SASAASRPMSEMTDAESSPVPASSITSASVISLIGRDAALAEAAFGAPFCPETFPAVPRYPSGLRAIVPTLPLTLSSRESCEDSVGCKPLDSGDLDRIGSSGKGMVRKHLGEVQLD